MNFGIADLTAYRAKVPQYAEQLERHPHDHALRIDSGYLATNVARIATENQYRKDFGVPAIAPGLERFDLDDLSQPRVGAYLAEAKPKARDLIRQIIDDEIVFDASHPLRKLSYSLLNGWSDDDMTSADYYTIGINSIQASIGLLGLHEFGAVVAAWQLSTLALKEIPWREYVTFNREVAHDARQLYEPSASAAAVKYGLPGLNYIIAGCIGNVAKAGYREFADSHRQNLDACEIADQAMRELEEMPNSVTDLLLFPTMKMMRAACTNDDGYWRNLSPEEARLTFAQLKSIEPFQALVAMAEHCVTESAR